MELQKVSDLLSDAEIPGKGVPESELAQPASPQPRVEHTEPDQTVAVQSQPALEHGAVFGGCFKLQRALGSGDEGGVWLAEDLRLGRTVILKLLPEVICHHPGALAELKDVTRRSSELVHPHIARTYGFVEGGEIGAVALEYVEGKTLTQLRMERPHQVFEAKDLRMWLRSLCEALNHAHNRTKLVHGGLSPDNLLVTPGGELMLIGFGLAGQIKRWLARLDSRSEHDLTVSASGPPRPAEGQLAPTDDVHGVGVTLYELLTGTVPFEGEGRLSLVSETSVVPISARRAELGVKGEVIPESWDRAVTACLAKDPIERPQSVKELAERLSIFPPLSEE